MEEPTMLAAKSPPPQLQLTVPKGRDAMEYYQKILEAAATDPEAMARLKSLLPQLIAMAKEDIKAWRLATPPGKNALDKLKIVLDPENRDAKAGLRDVVGQYIKLAYKFHENPSRAADFLAKAEAILPDDTRITKARRWIFRDESEMEATPPAEVVPEADADMDMGASENSSPGMASPLQPAMAADMAAIQDLLRRARINFNASRLTIPPGRNAMDRYRAVLKLDPGNEEAKRRLALIAEKLIALADGDIEEWRLSSPPGKNAMAKLAAAMELDPDNPAIKSGLKKVVDRYIRLAFRYKRDPDKAEGYLDRAEAILPKDRRIAEARSEILDF